MKKQPYLWKSAKLVFLFLLFLYPSVDFMILYSFDFILNKIFSSHSFHPGMKSSSLHIPGRIGTKVVPGWDFVPVTCKHPRLFFKKIQTFFVYVFENNKEHPWNNFTCLIIYCMYRYSKLTTYIYYSLLGNLKIFVILNKNFPNSKTSLIRKNLSVPWKFGLEKFHCITFF